MILCAHARGHEYGKVQRPIFCCVSLQEIISRNNTQEACLFSVWVYFFPDAPSLVFTRLYSGGEVLCIELDFAHSITSTFEIASATSQSAEFTAANNVRSVLAMVNQQWAPLIGKQQTGVKGAFS